MLEVYVNMMVHVFGGAETVVMHLAFLCTTVNYCWRLVKTDITHTRSEERIQKAALEVRELREARQIKGKTNVTK